MKTIMLGLVIMGLAGAALAIEPADLDNRIRELTVKFEALQSKADKRIPAETLRKARGIILLDRTKAGFIFAYQGGGGVAMVKGTNNDTWSPAAFVGASEASLGFQIGGEQDFYVILLMTDSANQFLTEPKSNFGGEARGTAGDSSAGSEGKVNTGEPPYIVYAMRKGLYAGAAIKGGAITPDNDANHVYYGQFVTMRDILFDQRVKATQTATDLAMKINDLSKANGASASAKR